MIIEYGEGRCVMCGRVGEYIAEETNELLCKKCMLVNEEIKERKRIR